MGSDHLLSCPSSSTVNLSEHSSLDGSNPEGVFSRAQDRTPSLLNDSTNESVPSAPRAEHFTIKLIGARHCDPRWYQLCSKFTVDSLTQSAVKDMEVIWNSASLAELQAQAASTICLSFSTSPQRFPLLTRYRPVPACSRIAEKVHLPVWRALNQPAPSSENSLPDRPQEPRCIPGVVVSVKAARLPAGSAWQEAEMTCSPPPDPVQPRPAPRRTVHSCASTDVSLR